MSKPNESSSVPPEAFQEMSDRAILNAMGCTRDPDDCNMHWYREQYRLKFGGGSDLNSYEIIGVDLAEGPSWNPNEPTPERSPWEGVKRTLERWAFEGWVQSGELLAEPESQEDPAATEQTISTIHLIEPDPFMVALREHQTNMFVRLGMKSIDDIYWVFGIRPEEMGLPGETAPNPPPRAQVIRDLFKSGALGVRSPDQQAAETSSPYGRSEVEAFVTRLLAVKASMTAEEWAQYISAIQMQKYTLPLARNSVSLPVEAASSEETDCAGDTEPC